MSMHNEALILTTADFRKAYQGYGRALRQRHEPPLDGEPWMSMDDAAKLSAELVARHCAGKLDFAEQDEVKKLRTVLSKATASHWQNHRHDPAHIGSSAGLGADMETHIALFDCDDDAVAAVAAFNALPKMLDALEAACGEIARLRAALGLPVEIGQAVIDAADHIRKFLPEHTATVPFELDGAAYQAVVSEVVEP